MVYIMTPVIMDTIDALLATVLNLSLLTTIWYGLFITLQKLMLRFKPEGKEG